MASVLILIPIIFFYFFIFLFFFVFSIDMSRGDDVIPWRREERKRHKIIPYIGGPKQGNNIARS